MVFEDVDVPGFKTRDGIAEIEGNLIGIGEPVV